MFAIAQCCQPDEHLELLVGHAGGRGGGPLQQQPPAGMPPAGMPRPVRQHLAVSPRRWHEDITAAHRNQASQPDHVPPRPALRADVLLGGGGGRLGGMWRQPAARQ